MRNNFYHLRIPEGIEAINMYGPVPIIEKDRKIFSPYPKKRCQREFSPENEMESLIFELSDNIRRNTPVNIKKYDRRFKVIISHIRANENKERYQDKYRNLRRIITN